jgi:transglutaminase-like putative cysteine protease
MLLRRWFAISSAPIIVLTIASYRLPVVNAAVGFQPVLPEELKMTREPLAPGAPAIVLFRQVDRDDTGRTAHQDDYFRIKILTEEGRKYADIEIPFYKEHGNNVTGIKGRTIRPDGSIANFEGKVFEKAILKAKGLKYMAKTFTLPDIQVGSVIEYYYTYDLSEQFIYDSRWILSDELFTKKAAFSLRPYTSPYIPVGIRWSWQMLPEGTAPPKEGPDHVIRLEAANIPAFQTEDFMPPENELKSRVDFTYYTASMGAQPPDKFWKEIGKRRSDELESFVGKQKAMAQAVAQIVSPSDSDEEKLQKIYARVQQIRNTSYEVRKTQQEEKREKEKDLNNVEEVWKRGYGNGTQLTWLYLALVRAAGFEAYGVWASERRNYFFNPQQMDSYKLDANVVLVKLKGTDIYCDPGGAFTPFKLLTWEETGVQGLRLDKDGGTWIRTMIPPSSASRIERKADLKLSDSGDIEGNLTVTFTGLEALRRRVEERNVDEAERKTFLEDQVKEYIPAASEVDLKNKPDWNSSAVPLVAEFTLKIPGWASGAGRRALVPVGLFSATEHHLFDHAVRVHPIYFEFPFQKVDDITIELPAGWQTTSLPAAQNVDAKAVVYSLKVENDKNRLHLTRKLAVEILLAEAKYYAALRNFFQSVRTGDEEQIVLQPGTTVSVN